jgi:hypothetical protein
MGGGKGYSNNIVMNPTVYAPAVEAPEASPRHFSPSIDEIARSRKGFFAHGGEKVEKSGKSKVCCRRGPSRPGLANRREAGPGGCLKTFEHLFFFRQLGQSAADAAGPFSC